jgi:uncharacterized protein DUF4296
MKKRTVSLLIVVCLISGACGGKNSVPSGILPREKMEKVMWDMVMADQYASYLAKDSAHLDLKQERLRLYEQVFRLHDISRDKFQKSYAYYMEHPELNQLLFDSLTDLGSRLRTEAYSHPAVKPLVTPPPTAPATTQGGTATPGLPLRGPTQRQDTAGKGPHPIRPTSGGPPSSAPAGKRPVQ